MEADVRLLDIARMHPLLLWDVLVTAAAAVLSAPGRAAPFLFRCETTDVPGFGEEEVRLRISPEGVPAERIERLRRTYEPSRLVELTAIALAGLTLHLAGGHEIVDVSARGSGADYLVGAERFAREVAGRSRRVDLEAAWQQ